MHRNPEPSPRLSTLEHAVAELSGRVGVLESHGKTATDGASVDATLDRRCGQQNRLPTQESADRMNLLVFSAELDKLLAALVIATGAAASGLAVTMFFTFWGISALRRDNSAASKSLVERLFGFVLPRGMKSLPLSRLHMAGAGTAMMRATMKKKGIASPEELLDLAAELGVEIRVCSMSMDMLGVTREELIPYPHLEFCGVASFVESASRCGCTLFI